MRLKPRAFAASLLAVLVLTIGAPPIVQGQQGPLRIEVSIDENIYREPVTGRVLVFLSPTADPEPRFGGPLSALEPVVAVDVENLEAGEAAVIDVENWSRPDALSFPGPLRRLEPGTYHLQALIDTNQTRRDFNEAPGNLYGPIEEHAVHPVQSGLIQLTVDRAIEEEQPEDTEWVELAELRSDMLSAFHGRDVMHRAGVILPPGYHDNPEMEYPVVYVIPGFGGRHTAAWRWIEGPDGERWRVGDWPMPMIRVVLDPETPFGHHTFANSETNGPVGDAFVDEFIPYLESEYRIVSEPGARFLTGHSSGGWASLWLQVAYPEVFGGTWSTGPDPVDFRAFQVINVYEDANAYWDGLGHPRPSMRQDNRVVLPVREENYYEYVTGPGGQWGSWFAVFGPRGEDGMPVPGWDPLTGEIDHEVTEAWREYDIRLLLEENWETLGPQLQDKLHIIGGAEDNFYLERSLQMLKDVLDQHDHGGYVEIHPGDHGSFLTPELRMRIYEEMAEQYEARQ